MNYKMGFSDSKTGGKRPHTRPNIVNGKNLRVSSSDLMPSSRAKGSFRNIKGFNPFHGFNLGVFKRKDPKAGVSSINNTNKKTHRWRHALKKLFSIFAGLVFFVGLIGIIVIGVYLKQIEEKLPKPGELLDRKTSETTIIYDRNGVELYKIFPSNGTNRIYVKTSELHDYTIKALLASEDWQFYQHKGIDWLGNIRCIWLSTVSYLEGGNDVCGASTISQQLVRNTLMYDAFGDEAYERSTFMKTVQRKVREMLLTIEVEQSMTKDQILEMYINEVGVGGANNGFEAGAQTMFGKNAKDLTLAESAILVGVLPSPERYNPVFGTQPEKALERQTYVLDQMVKHKVELSTDVDQVEKARTEKIEYKTAAVDIKAPHFVWFVKEQLVKTYGVPKVERGGLKVITTIDMTIQDVAQEELADSINGAAKYPESGAKYGIFNGAVVGIDPRTQQILTMVGSVDYNNNTEKVDGNVNDALAPRQMGSSMKPYAYLTAFEAGYGPWMSTPDIDGFDFHYNAVNWDNDYKGFMTARSALVQSRNIPALFTLQTVGIPSFIQTAERLGITTLKGTEDYGLSLVLGGANVNLLEHTAAYSVFANEGIKKNVVSILKVTDKDGTVLEEYHDDPGVRVFDEKDIYMLNYTLCDLDGHGDQILDSTYLRMNGRRAVCGKGGTNLKNIAPTDIVQMSYHKNFVLGVWMGNNDNSEFIPGGFSSTVTLPVAMNILERISGRFVPETYNRPAGVASTTVCKSTGAVPVNGQCDGFGLESSVYVIGRGPKQDNRKSITVCAANGKIPSNLEQARKFSGLVKDMYLIEGYNVADADQHTTFANYIAARPGLGLLLKKPETAECPLPLGPNDSPTIDITKPANNKTYNVGDNVDIGISYRVKNSVKNVKYYLDGTLIPGGTVTTAPYNFNFNVTASMSQGNHEVSIIMTDSDNKTGVATFNIVVSKPTPTSTPTPTPTPTPSPIIPSIIPTSTPTPSPSPIP
jgi:membrane peptidoglycan carboxypeptidase